MGVRIQGRGPVTANDRSRPFALRGRKASGGSARRRVAGHSHPRKGSSQRIPYTGHDVGLAQLAPTDASMRSSSA